MQIFSPLPEFDKIAACLDNKRLNKQKIEIWQILNVLFLDKNAKGWKNHPAVLMAKTHERFFIKYAFSIVRECLNRNFKDTINPKLEELWGKFSNKSENAPAYWGTNIFHSSHRSNLLRKNPEWYGQFDWSESPDMEYWWPTKNGY